MASTAELRARFRALHDDGIFVMPNPWDVGSARLLASLGFPALATTSAGFAWTLGVNDQQVTRDQLLEHAAVLAAATDLPLNVDSERCYADDPAGVAETVGLLAGTGAAGCSIEDWDPVRGGIDELDTAVERVGAAAEAAHRGADTLVLTARCENHLYRVADLDDTIARLRAYRAAGADAVYAPGLVSIGDIERVVREVGAPVNVLATLNGPSVAELGAAGVRRVSTGGSLAAAALGAVARAATELRDAGTSRYIEDRITSQELRAAFPG